MYNNDMTRMQKVLTHGKSRVVIALLREAAKTKNFSVSVTEGKSTASGYDDVSCAVGCRVLSFCSVFVDLVQRKNWRKRVFLRQSFWTRQLHTTWNRWIL